MRRPVFCFFLFCHVCGGIWWALLPLPQMPVFNTLVPDDLTPAFLYHAFDKTGSTFLQGLLKNHTKSLCILNWRKNDGCAQIRAYGVVVEYRSEPDMQAASRARVADFCSRRKCFHFTLLRSPTQRLYSAYNYFCRQCAEAGRQCGRFQDPEHITCPNMSLGSYSKYFGNMYVDAFKGNAPSESLAALVAAYTWLQTNALVLFSERDLHGAETAQRLWTWMDTCMKTSNKAKLRISTKHNTTNYGDLANKSVEVYLFLDILLYKELKYGSQGDAYTQRQNYAPDFFYYPENDTCEREAFGSLLPESVLALRRHHRNELPLI